MAGQRLIVIGGPTASGKSALAVALCRRLEGEVVSCDSMQLYRGMDIGTATPTPQEMEGVPHYLLSVLAPGTPCSAAAYRAMALPVIQDILNRGKTPVLCGGTGLYIDALTRPLGFSVKGDEGLRRELEALPREVLHQRLAQVDPESAARLHPNDQRRVVRALEVYLLTGASLSSHMARDRGRAGDFSGVLFALDWPRPVLYARIDRRVEQMMDQGLAREVKALLAGGLKAGDTAMQAIGYKELAAYFGGEGDLDQAVRAIQQNTRRYAKRQLTWFRRDERVHWLAAEGRKIEDITEEIIDILRNLPNVQGEERGEP